MSKYLPVTSPILTSWQWHANVLTILQNHVDTQDWIYCNYIHLFSEMDLTKHAYVDLMPMFPNMSCPWIHTQNIARNILKNMRVNTLDFLINAIEENCYIYAMFDMNYINKANKYSGNKKISPHDMFIFGYDSELEQFHAFDFIFTGKYSSTHIPYNEVVDAYNNLDPSFDTLNDGAGGLQLLSFNKHASFKYDAILVKESFYEYLHSINPTEKFRMQNNPRRFSFGMKVYDAIISFLEYLEFFEGRFDVRPLHVLYDHKVMMFNRIKYMESNKLVKTSGEYLSSIFQKIAEECLIIRNMFLKVSYTKNRIELKEIINKIKSLVPMECEAIEQVIDSIIIDHEVSFENKYNGKKLWWEIESK